MSFLSSSLRVFDLSLGQMLWSRRTVFMALIVGGPVLIALIVRALALLGLPAVRIDGTAVGGTAIFGGMIWGLYLRVAVPALAIFYGTALMADEIEDKTITYLFARPIPRGAVLIGKYLAYVVCTVMVVLPSVMIVYFLIVPWGGADLASTFVDLLKDLAILAVGLAVYGAVFALVGAWFKRPVLIGLLFAFGWESIVQAVPGYFKKLTILYYLQGLVPHALPQDGLMSVLQNLFRDVPSLSTCLLVLGLVWAAALTLAARIVGRREYVLEQ